MSKKNDKEKGEKAAQPVATPKSGSARLALIVLELAGVAVSLYLTYLKVKAGAAGEAACNISQTLSCDDVLASKYSSIFGVPTSWLGIIVYLSMLVTTILGGNPSKGRVQAHAPLYVFAASIWNVIFSVYLAIISSFVLQKYCTNCIALYFVNIGLLGASFVWMKSSGESLIGTLISDFKDGIKNAWVWAGIACLALILAVSHVGFGKIIGSPTSGLKVSFKGKVLADYPTIGSANAPVQIVEFSDLKCPFCRKTHEVLEQARHNYGDKFSVTFVHFPLDNACNFLMQRAVHQGACLAASATRCAQNQGKFWEMLSVVFTGQDEVWDMAKMKEYAGKAGADPNQLEACINDPATLQYIRDNVALGNEMKIQRTPTVFFNGVEVQSFSGRGMPGFLEELQKAIAGETTPPEQPK